MDHCLVLNTCPDLETAEALAALLVEQKLAACVNIVPGVRSVYAWKGAVVKEGEVLLLIKSRADAYPQLEETVKAHHPYDVPEVIALPIDTGLSSYLAWIDTHLENKK